MVFNVLHDYKYLVLDEKNSSSYIYDILFKNNDKFPNSAESTIMRAIREYRSRLRGDFFSDNSVVKTRNVLLIPDLHFPFEHKEAYDFVQWALATHSEITDIVFTGDIIDNHFSSFHDSDPDGISASIELSKAKKIVEKWKKLIPKALVCIGNHDAIPNRKAFKAGLSSSWVKTLNEVLDVPNWSFKVEHRIGKVGFFHGMGLSSKKKAEITGISQAAGHLHTKFESISQYNHSSKEVVHAIYSGALIDDESYAFAYAKHFPPSIKGLTIIFDVEGLPYVKQIPLDYYLKTEKDKWKIAANRIIT